jgi:hypothetical protein
MTLPAPVARHHTAWIHCDSCRPHAVRYAVDGDRMICFGDDLPAEASAGRTVVVAVHEIAGGPALAEMTTTIRDVTADQIDANALLDLLEHVPLGRTRSEVDAALTRHRERRIVALDNPTKGTYR